MMMETSLPDLPFPDYGRAELHPSGVHSSGQTAPRRYPRTDLQAFVPWTSFPNDIHQAVTSAALEANISGPLNIDALKIRTPVVNEESLRAHAMFALHIPAQQVLNRLGVIGEFGCSGAGNAALIGDPDFAWIMHIEDQPHPKLVVEYKTWWAADLDLPKAWNGRRNPHQTTLDRQSLDALQHVYGYMTFNNNKFGILTNWKKAWFLRRLETPGSDRKTLEYFLVKLDGVASDTGPQPHLSMLKAWVGMVLLANNDWFYASPTLANGPPGQNFRFEGPLMSASRVWKRAYAIAEEFNSQLNQNGQYQCLPLDFRLCHFDLSSARHGAHGCVVTANLLKPPKPLNLLPRTWTINGNLNVICKVIDVLRYPDEAGLLEEEARAYAALRNLQGRVIPKLYGFYEMWGILRFLALEPVGNAISEKEDIDQKLRQQMRMALQHIHNAKYIHGDIARRNFCRKGRNGEVFLVDLERCRPANPTELQNEMNEVNYL